jgi:hypothetical protein
MRYSSDQTGNVASRTASLLLAPQIAGHPVQQTAATGDVVTFSVVVSDARGVTYQWQFNGTDIAGATGDSLVLGNVSVANEGSYSVVAANGEGTVTSVPAALTLDVDRDELPDSWEVANFGSEAAQRGGGDPDRDGSSNLDEFAAGTDPNSNASLRPRLTARSGVGGSVTMTPMKLDYDFAESVVLTPRPFPPSVFLGWAGDLSGAANPATLTMDRNKTVRARFATAVALPPSLIALWRGETDASDLIGGHDGAFFAGLVAVAPTVTPIGKVAGAFEFDGVVHVRVPDATELRPARLTLEAWVFPTVRSNTFQTIIARGSSTDDTDTWILGLGGATNRPQFFSHRNSFLEGTTTIPLNEWTHLATTFDGSIKRIYVNGSQVVSGEVSAALVYDAAPVPVTIGSDWTNNATNARFNGRIAEVGLYGRALTADEILGIANADSLGKQFSQPYFTSPDRLPDATLGVSYAQQVTTILGAAPVIFSLSAGELPSGMSLSSLGVVSGVAGEAGIYDFSVLARDAANLTNEQECSIQVS